MENITVALSGAMLMILASGLLVACLVIYALARVTTVILLRSLIHRMNRHGSTIVLTLGRSSNEQGVQGTLDQMIAFFGLLNSNGEERLTFTYLARQCLESTGSVRIGLTLLDPKIEITSKLERIANSLEGVETPSEITQESTQQKTSKKPCLPCLKIKKAIMKKINRSAGHAGGAS